VQCTALHCTALHCTALHCTALHVHNLVDGFLFQETVDWKLAHVKNVTTSFVSFVMQNPFMKRMRKKTNVKEE
jgi:hypothetical protein